MFLDINCLIKVKENDNYVSFPRFGAFEIVF